MRARITILFPVYNAGKFLRPSLESIFHQSFQDFELLIIDDASTDESAEIISSYKADKRVRILKNEENLGIAGTLNRGLEAASGEWIARYDPDDLSNSNRLKKQVRILEQDEDAIAVFSRARLVDDRNRLIGWVRTPTHIQAIRWDLCFQNTLFHGSVLFRKKYIWEKLGGYRLLRACEDYDLWSRILRNQGKIIVLKDHLVDYRIHPYSIMGKEYSEGFIRSHDSMREIMKANLQALMPATLSEQQMNILSSAWIDPKTADWGSFFTIQKEMLRLFQSDVRKELRQTLVEEDFSLYRKCRQSGCALPFLQSLSKLAPDRFAALPWIRILGDKVLSTLHWRSPR